MLRVNAIWDHNLKVTIILGLAIAGIELVLILIKLVQAFKQVKPMGNTFHERLLHIKKCMPIIILVINLLSIVQSLQADSVSDTSMPNLPNLGGWNLLVYYFSGTQIILNLKKANCKITESIHSQGNATSIRFNYNTQEDNDEGGVEGAAGDGEMIEEIHS
ncbi:hypothetical protein P691DRAFT_781043 [Macrolepiota fuliginosa MF-IS2]|uniref:Uncharacterized protein n=1 Tax=Macrolepiota fuliginosa MF-IS2 TaxID=1400762 RepID=A0A9P6C4G3_9AGAR|nr:hypothetical protein P691DRAFT_781043 [Macrolepiota fuliginosa MF-IS2]